jgi:hypothetical protein
VDRIRNVAKTMLVEREGLDVDDRRDRVGEQNLTT